MWDDVRDDSAGHDQVGSGDAGLHCTVKSRYVPSASPHARKRLQDQVYYLHVRDQEDAEDSSRHLFTAQDTEIDRPGARDLLWSNRSVKSVCFHRVILSPSRGLGIETAGQAQEWARGVMAALGQRLDRDLTWVAAVHGNTGRTHVHVLIAGEAARVSAGEDRRVVRLGRADLDALRGIAVDVARPIREAAREREQDERAAQLRRELDAMVYRPVPAVPVQPLQPQQPVNAAGSKERAHASFVRRLLHRGA